VESVATDVAAADAAEVIVVDAAPLGQYTADGYVQALAALILQENPALVFLPHTYQTRDFAPALAARLGRALVTDATAVRKQDDGFVYTRPVFQGKLGADVSIEDGVKAAQACAKPVLIRVEVQGSHGYRPTDKLIAERADQWAFAAEQMGMR